MRRKAEQKIREAAEILGSSDQYRLDKIRELAGLNRKVFDKTVLDMARLGDIALVSGGTENMSATEIGNLVRQGEQIYVTMSFVEKDVPEKKIPPKTVTIMLKGINKEEWMEFERCCMQKEGKKPVRKIRELICKYIREE
jgi:hypothetical protein